MSQITDNTTGQTFEGLSFIELSASIAASSDSTFNGRKFDPVGLDIIPSRLKTKDQVRERPYEEMI